MTSFKKVQVDLQYVLSGASDVGVCSFLACSSFCSSSGEMFCGFCSSSGEMLRGMDDEFQESSISTFRRDVKYALS